MLPKFTRCFATPGRAQKSIITKKYLNKKDDCGGGFGQLLQVIASTNKSFAEITLTINSKTFYPKSDLMLFRK